MVKPENLGGSFYRTTCGHGRWYFFGRSLCPLRSHSPANRWPVSDPEEKLTPADPDEFAAALACALRFSGRERAHDADTFMGEIVAKRLVEDLERSRFVVMKRPISLQGGSSA